jgi:hypothetical protein
LAGRKYLEERTLESLELEILGGGAEREGKARYI